MEIWRWQWEDEMMKNTHSLLGVYAVTYIRDYYFLI